MITRGWENPRFKPGSGKSGGNMKSTKQVAFLPKATVEHHLLCHSMTMYLLALPDEALGVGCQV